MAINPSGALAGGALTGLTSPTHTWTASQAPEPNQKQFTVTAIGGTQSGAAPHAAARQWWFNYAVPRSYKAAKFSNTTGLLITPGKNVHRLLYRNSVPTDPHGYGYDNFEIDMAIRVPVGADVGGSVTQGQFKAGWSGFVGLINNQCQGIYDTLVTQVA